MLLWLSFSHRGVWTQSNVVTVPSKFGLASCSLATCTTANLLVLLISTSLGATRLQMNFATSTSLARRSPSDPKYSSQCTDSSCSLNLFASLSRRSSNAGASGLPLGQALALQT